MKLIVPRLDGGYDHKQPFLKSPRKNSPFKSRVLTGRFKALNRPSLSYPQNLGKVLRNLCEKIYSLW